MKDEDITFLMGEIKSSQFALKESVEKLIIKVDDKSPDWNEAHRIAKANVVTLSEGKPRWDSASNVSRWVLRVSGTVTGGVIVGLILYAVKIVYATGGP